MNEDRWYDSGWALLITLLVLVILIAGIAGGSWACFSSATSPMDKYTLVYQGGPLDGRAYIKTVNPGNDRFWKGNLNSIYRYPATQRTYVISMDPNIGDVEGEDQLIVNTKGANKIYLELALAFNMVPENLQLFHEKLGLKYAAWEDDGWDKFLEEQVRQPLATAFQEEAKKYSNIDACNEAGMTQMGDAVSAVIQNRIDAYMNGHYIKVLSLSLTKASPDTAVQSEIENIAKSKQAIETAQNNFLAAEKNAEANRILRESLQGEGGMTAVLQKAVESGKVNFWVIPSGTELVAPTPTEQ